MGNKQGEFNLKEKKNSIGAGASISKESIDMQAEQSSPSAFKQIKSPTSPD